MELASSSIPVLLQLDLGIDMYQCTITFFAAYLDPQTKSLLKDMMTIVDFGKLKSDIIDHMVTE